MPKILINEKDKTSPGTPGAYANYTVLVVGFSGKQSTDGGSTIEADSNGVYNFTSAADFAKTVGLVGPKKAIETQFGNTVYNYHYGNQMAYELLGLGYPILYKVIKSTSELSDETFWDIFKDKANYDFRFITHGLLTSTDWSNDAGYSAQEIKLSSLENELHEITEALKVLSGLVSEAEKANKSEGEIKTLIDNAYEALMNDEYDGLSKQDYEGLLDQESNNYYTSYDDAKNKLELRYTETNTSILTLKTQFDSVLITRSEIAAANKCIADLATYYIPDSSISEPDSTKLPGRGDCIALIELDEKIYTDTTSGRNPEELIIDAINEQTIDPSSSGRFCAVTVPSVSYKMAIDEKKPNDFDNNVKFPGAFHYLACFANSLNQGFAEWYAAAGYTRGISKYTIKDTTVKLGEIAINALEPRNRETPQENHPKFACNVIANFRGSYYLWGNRTAYELKEEVSGGDLVASHFLNIRQLCTTIKKQLYVACRRFTFDPNSDTLWFNFINAIKPTLERMKADQGIRDYKIIKITDNPKKATLKAKIRIIPIEAVEDFDLEVSLEDSFGETAATVTE